ncbi:MAG TPA: hypothetical protein VEF71_10895 [Streptosporangiaceae bacterium]|nr:hypothetical protein [Streptosporangiaceae bacterium]
MVTTSNSYGASLDGCGHALAGDLAVEEQLIEQPSETDGSGPA